MDWKEIALAVVATPVAVIIVYMVFRAAASGVARSWFQARREYEQSENKGEKNADPDQSQ